MFEDSVFASAAGRGSRRTRLAVAAAIGAQVAVLGVVLVAPLLRPEGLPVVLAAPTVMLTAVRRPEVKPEPVKPRVVRVTNATAMRMPAGAAPQASSRAVIARGGGSTAAGTDGPALLALHMGGEGGPVLGPGSESVTAVRVVRAAAGTGAETRGPVRISSGVVSGMLLTPIRPVYPRMAVTTRQEGTVVVTAVIDKSGRIVGLKVVSGPPMLREAALDALRAARYRPYLLNGEATEVETTISVNFRLGAG